MRFFEKERESAVALVREVAEFLQLEAEELLE